MWGSQTEVGVGVKDGGRCGGHQTAQVDQVDHQRDKLH